ncbi:MAG: copper oxidase [Hyphomicrobiales bacterium]|nr:MAG: copper oxidase [Hyphomicrobiales bacterium]
MALSRRGFLVASAATLAATPGAIRVAWADDGFLEITARPASQKLFSNDNPPSDLWTYNGRSPGPELRVTKGERVRVRLINELDEPTSIHWHGVRIDNAMDGVAGLTQQPVPPGERFEYDFVAPDAGTYWYHAHTKSWNQVARGLYGALIVEEHEPSFDNTHDLTIVIDDWQLDEQGRFDPSGLGSLMEWSHAGRLGNWLTVNGTSIPNFMLNAGEPYRLRLINVCNARILEIDPRPLRATVLAVDGQPLAEPEPLSDKRLRLAPAQRIDLAVTPKAGRNLSLVEISARQPFTFATFAVTGSDAGSGARAAALPANLLADPDPAAAHYVILDMTGGAMGDLTDITYKGKPLTVTDIRETGQVWAFNGIANLADEPLFRVRRGKTVIVEMSNDTAFAHAMHTHGHHFRILGADGKPGAEWRDTLILEQSEKARIAFVADNPGKWLFHCHMLEHAAAGMSTWFEVV